MALLLLFILILSTTSTDAVQCLPGEGFGLLTKRGFYKGSYPGYRSCPSGKPIDNYKDCSKAAHLLYSNAYFFTSYDRTNLRGARAITPLWIQYIVSITQLPGVSERNGHTKCFAKKMLG